jgi:hypothetical protein
MIKNFNTIEEFRNADKPTILQTTGNTVSLSACTLPSLSSHILQDLGSDKRWNNLLLPVTPSFVYYFILR